MRNFHSAVVQQIAEAKRQEIRDQQKKLAEEKVRKNAVVRRLAPFKKAVSSLEELMSRDPEFKKFMEEQVITHTRRGSFSIIGLASKKFGCHDVQDGWRYEMTPTYKEVHTVWVLVVTVSEKGKVELECHNNDSPVFWSPEDVPKEVCTAFLPVLAILQDKNRVYSFLLKHSNS